MVKKACKGLCVLGVVLVTLGVLASYVQCPAPPPYSGWSTTRDCGAVSLYVVCRTQGRSDVSLDYLRSLTATDVDGTNMLRVKEAAEHLGFQVRAARIRPRALTREIESGAMAILHSPVGRGGHFMPIVGITADRRFFIVDGANGVLVLSADDLVSQWAWEGAALL